jgi:pimeloyl-ACP methyl ester carboxylesterase
MRRTVACAGKRPGRVVHLIVELLLVMGIVAAALALAQWRSPVWVTAKIIKASLFLEGIQSHYVTIDGQELHYVEGGTGDPVVLVHGLGSSAQEGWSEIMPYLVHSGHHVYAMDLLGFGESAKPPDRSYSITEQARLLEKFLDTQHLQKVALAGESMGGWISAVAALDQPQRISQLILFDSAGLWFKPSFDLALFTPHTKEQLDALIAILMPHPLPIPNYVKEDLIRTTRRDGWVIERALASMTAGGDLLDRRFSSLKMPLLIVWGRQDLLTPLTIGEAMHHVAPQSVLAVYDGCGHIAVKTCADRIAPLTVNFLAGSGPQAGRTIEIPEEQMH